MAAIAQAQTAPAGVDAASTQASADVVVSPAPAPSKPVTTSVKEKAAEAATATLSALLPRLAASDTLPLVDRSAMVAGDISKLLAAYDLSKEGVVAQEQQGGKVQAVLQRALALMGTPYRWGGKTPAGIDCSGLCSMAYLLCGISIWRDSELKEGYPIHPAHVSDMRVGDLVYFPGHVALYLGNGEYIHSTARAGDNGVVINSFYPDSPLYRPDLPKQITAVGSYFARREAT